MCVHKAKPKRHEPLEVRVTCKWLKWWIINCSLGWQSYIIFKVHMSVPGDARFVTVPEDEQQWREVRISGTMPMDIEGTFNVKI